MSTQSPTPFVPARNRSWLGLVLLLAGAIQSGPVRAYPPAPFHLFYGTLRDEYGTPLNTVEAEVILETSSGVRVKTAVNPGIEPGANYRLEVPMDAGLMAAPYQPTALRPFVPFRVKVRIGRTTYLPIESAGDYTSLGQPGLRTRLNLTLGEDANGDGLPDAWQRLINVDISQVKPDADAGNGLTYLQTYYAGTYAVDPKNGFVLNLISLTGDAPLLEFLAVTGRTYTLVGSADLTTWNPLTFRLPAEGAKAVTRASYQTDSVKTVRVEVVNSDPHPPPTYFRLLLQ
jgi:hypothetical protein